MATIDTSPLSEHANISNTNFLLSTFDWLDRSILIIDHEGYILDINTYALKVYGIKSKSSFLIFKPNIYYSLSLKSSLGITIKDTKTISIKVLFDYDLFNRDFPGVGYRTGKALHLLSIHPIYDNNNVFTYILLSSTDLSTQDEDTAANSQLRNSLPILMNAGGISTWTYDILSGRRILDSGAHLFPKLEYMDDFLNNIQETSRQILNNTIALIKYGKKTQDHIIIQFQGENNSGDIIYLEVFCIPQFVDNKIKGIFFLTIDVTSREINK